MKTLGVVVEAKNHKNKVNDAKTIARYYSILSLELYKEIIHLIKCAYMKLNIKVCKQEKWK